VYKQGKTGYKLPPNKTEKQKVTYNSDFHVRYYPWPSRCCTQPYAVTGRARL